MRFYKDNFGINDLEIESDKHVIADFFSSDIQGSTYNLNVSVEACKAVANHEIPEWEGTGNAHTVTIKPDGVSIENAYTYDELRLSSIAEFEWYLKQWEKLITTGEEFTIESPFK
ncbi:TPA: hypothetical protein ACSP7Y_005089 [Serratia fonticola]